VPPPFHHPVVVAVAVAVPLQRAERADDSLSLATELIPGVVFHSNHHASSGNGSHYEDPYETKCASEEVNITIVGVPGAMCSPVCGIMDSCPKDVPENITAKPKCALQDMAGRKFCALLCSMTLPVFNQRVADEQCGPKASCKPISSVGICTYDE